MFSPKLSPLVCGWGDEVEQELHPYVLKNKFR